MLDFFKDSILATSMFSWFVAQLLKIIIVLIKDKKLDFSRLVGSGGMPSSHSSLVCSLTTAIGFANGFTSDIFYLSTVFSLIVMYDASGVRRAAGEQAKILNQMLEDYENKNEFSHKKLKELLGHTPLQVVMGALLGIAISVLIHFA